MPKKKRIYRWRADDINLALVVGATAEVTSPASNNTRKSSLGAEADDSDKPRRSDDVNFVFLVVAATK